MILLWKYKSRLSGLIEILEHFAVFDFRNNRSETPLIAAAKNGAVKAMKKLIELGAIVDHKHSQGNTAFHYAESKAGRPAVV